MRKKKKMKKYLILGMILLLISIPCVMALRIDPAWPVMLESPATFTVWGQTTPSYDTVMDFVVSEDCYNGMGADPVIEVTYDPGTGVETIITINKAYFVDYTVNSDKYPDFPNVEEGAKYTVASLKDHLSYDLSVPIGETDTIYIANQRMGHEDFDPLGSEPKEVTITLDSTAPRMLIYMHGASEDGGNYDLKVPPTIPGFIVPEVAIGSIMAVAAMFTALGLFAYKKKHTPKQ
jgi:hypothetical protein